MTGCSACSSGAPPTIPTSQGAFTTRIGVRYGPPHASSTAVYLEGLIDAYQLAVKENDQARRKSYKAAIMGLAVSTQIQFIDGVDMFYIEKDKRHTVYGGLRTTDYDNRIRVDNVQHALMGSNEFSRCLAPKAAGESAERVVADG